MAGIFGGDALHSLAAATPAEQVERIDAFDTYERGLIAHVQGLQAPVAEAYVNPYEGKEGENLHFWVRERSRFLACKQGKRELHEYIQEMRVLAVSLVGDPLPEHIKVTVFMDGLKVGPSRTQLFRVHANTMEEGDPDRPPRGVQPSTCSYSYVGVARPQYVVRRSNKRRPNSAIVVVA
ncbi:Gag protein [Phytophthora palmivora]|uniref:Gag protein n=1 Tax=Phytophthora palmivora TaxID=4796 RepID=A0A2P4WZP8_9STRA|nr:Gag protein [Phytophthora palmivora]